VSKALDIIPAAFVVDPYPSLARRKESKQFFFEKKNQKTFVLIASRALTLPHRAHQ
jgi:hypothetical protein